MTCRNPMERLSADDILNSFEYKYLKERFGKTDTDE